MRVIGTTIRGPVSIVQLPLGPVSIVQGPVKLFLADKESLTGHLSFVCIFFRQSKFSHFPCVYSSTAIVHRYSFSKLPQVASVLSNKKLFCVSVFVIMEIITYINITEPGYSKEPKSIRLIWFIGIYLKGLRKGTISSKIHSVSTYIYLRKT